MAAVIALMIPASVNAMDGASSACFGDLLTHLVNAYETDSSYDQYIQAELDEIKSLSDEDYALAEAVADNWREVFLDPDYRLYLYEGEDVAAEMADAGIPDDHPHAIVVLGYELRDGEMQEELKERCEAAAALAKAFPETILVCSGGATGENNTAGNTEAGLMKAYLTENCGIDDARIFTDEQAMTTAENAMNTFSILEENNLHTMTLVTSTYHMRWAQAVYNCAALVYYMQQGYDIENVANYCFETSPSKEMYRMGDRIAAFQIAGILGLPDHVIHTLPSFHREDKELSTTEYGISFVQPDYGTISADKDSALYGERVTVNLDLDRKHQAVSVKYNDREAFRNCDGTFSFLMPDADALITVELEDCDPADTATDFGVARKMPVPFGTASASSAYFIYPCAERLSALPWDLLQLVPEEGYNWEYDYVADKPAWKLTLMDYANIYSFIHDHTLDPEEVHKVLSDADKMVHRKAFTDEEIDLLLGDDEEAVMEYFASDSTIVIGNKGYSAGWMYNHTIEEYEAEGITPEMVQAVLPYYYNPLYVQEAADAFSRKLFRFTSVLAPTKCEQWKAGDANLDDAVNVKDVVLLQKYLDEISRMDFEQWASAEMTGDSIVDEADMEILLRKILVGKEDEPTVLLDVMEYCQYPDYPTGCESVSLFMLLKYYGLKVTVDEIYDLLPMGQQPYDDEKGVRHGANPEREFVGDPRSDYSYGVFHEPIAKVAEHFKPGVKAQEGATIDDIKAILDTGNPVLAWYVSQPMRDIMYRWRWLDERNETVYWPGGEHAVVICGYDDDALIYRDPNAGTTVVIDYETFEKSFNELNGRIVYYTGE